MQSATKKMSFAFIRSFYHTHPAHSSEFFRIAFPGPFPSPMMT